MMMTTTTTHRRIVHAFALLFMVALVMTMMVSADDDVPVSKQIVEMLDHLKWSKQLERENHPSIKQLERCTQDGALLATRVTNQAKDLADMKDSLWTARVSYENLNATLVTLRKELMREETSHLTLVAMEKTQIELQLKLVKTMEDLMRTMRVKNPERANLVDQLLAIIENLREKLLQRLKDIEVSLVVQGLIEKIRVQEGALGDAERKIESLSDDYDKAAKVHEESKEIQREQRHQCERTAAEVKNVGLQFDEELKKIQEIRDQVMRIADGALDGDNVERRRVTWKEVRDRVYELLQDLVNKMEGVNDPEMECTAKTNEMKRIIEQKTTEEKSVAAEIAYMRENEPRERRNVAHLNDQIMELQGRLQEITVQCNLLGQNTKHDSDFLKEIGHINDLIDTVNTLDKEQKISADAAKKINGVLLQVVDDLKHNIDSRMKQATRDYNTCKQREKNTYDDLQLRREELSKLTAKLERHDEKLQSLVKRISVLRSEMDIMQDQLESRAASCRDAAENFRELHEQTGQEIKAAKTVYALMKKFEDQKEANINSNNKNKNQ